MKQATCPVFWAGRWQQAAGRDIVGYMKNPVLYLGDTSLHTAASYLAGVMHARHIGFDYVPSNERFASSMLHGHRRAVIVSDYPSANFTTRQLDALVEKVAGGMGLLMIGGWESFTGSGGRYNETPIDKVLPVLMSDSDDRVNCSQPCLVEKKMDHPILGRLPFERHPPCIGGFNRVRARSGALTLLVARRFDAVFERGSFKFTRRAKTDPLLAVGSWDKGRVCAFATDVAPHWVGGLVDWGATRVTAQAPGANTIEVGKWYCDLLSNIIRWVAGVT